MIIDLTIQREVERKLLEEYQRKKNEHIPSGKLSASRLGKPMQWNILKAIGVPPKELDEYVIRKLKRGDDVENWIVSQLKDVVDTQVKVEYNGVVGYADTIIDTKNYEAKVGVIVNEIKSISNANFRWIEKRKEINLGHALQAACYGLALKHKYFAVSYVATDDYRVITLIEETAKYKSKIDKIIDEYNYYLKNKIVPVFVPIEEWQKDIKYLEYPEWQNLSPTQIQEKLKDYKVKWDV